LSSGAKNRGIVFSFGSIGSGLFQAGASLGFQGFYNVVEYCHGVVLYLLFQVSQGGQDIGAERALQGWQSYSEALVIA
jgi:hypothetical protein